MNTTPEEQAMLAAIMLRDLAATLVQSSPTFDPRVVAELSFLSALAELIDGAVDADSAPSADQIGALTHGALVLHGLWADLRARDPAAEQEEPPAT